MLKQRAAGDKSWPIACSNSTLGTAGEELDLSGAHLSYGDFEDATFTGKSSIKLNGAGLAHADLSGSKLTADGGWGDSLIDFTEADLTNADLRGSELTALTIGNYGISTIDFTEATLANADLSGSKLTAISIVGLPPSPPSSSPSLPAATFTTKASLQTAVRAFNDNPAAATATYSMIADWDVSAITDMSYLFYNLKNFNADVSGWDTSGVTTIDQMFRYASAFNQPLSWDTSRVTTMFGMFWVRESRAHCGPAAVGPSSCLHFRRPNSCSPLPTRSSRPAPYIPLSTLGRERRRLTSR